VSALAQMSVLAEMSGLARHYGWQVPFWRTSHISESLSLAGNSPLEEPQKAAAKSSNSDGYYTITQRLANFEPTSSAEAGILSVNQAGIIADQSLTSEHISRGCSKLSSKSIIKSQHISNVWLLKLCKPLILEKSVWRNHCAIRYTHGLEKIIR
jgi:hypothetical protein